MIAVTLLDFLKEDLDMDVYLEQPTNVTDYILIDQTGSSQTNHITTTTLAIQSYAPSLYEAMVLNDRVKGAMERFAQLNEVARVARNGLQLYEHDHKAVSLAGRVFNYSLLGGTKWHRQ